jgi:ankyrin repeat protein
MASLLIAKGANVNAPDAEGNTPLHRAVFFARGRPEVVRLLRKHGSKDTLKNKVGETPRQMAERLGDPVFTSN